MRILYDQSRGSGRWPTPRMGLTHLRDATMPTKEELKNDLTKLLVECLDESSYTHVAAHPSNGNLPLDISYVRIEPWLYGTKAVTLRGAWELAVEYCLYYKKAPILAHQWLGEWSFRLPLYMLDEQYGTSLPPENQHRFEYSVDIRPEALGLVLLQYQVAYEARVTKVKSLVGVE